MLSRVRAFLSLLFLGLLVLAPATAASADTSNFEFESMHADYTISREPDGTSRLEVVETIIAVFPDFDQNRGIIRAIPDRYLDVPQETVITSVTDETGAAVAYESYNTGEFLELALGTDEFVRGEQSYVISYTQRHIVGAFADTASDEFYQDVNGIGYDQPFGEVSATVHVAADLTSTLSGFTGCAYGVAESDSQCELTSTVDADGRTSFEASVSDLGPRETLTINVGFAPDTFVQGVPVELDGPTTGGPVGILEAPGWLNAVSGVHIFAVIGVIIAAAVTRIRRGRSSTSSIIIPQYSVPKDLNVMVAAHLVDKGSTAIPAQLVSLAVRKNLRILDYPVTASGAEYTLQFLSTEGADPLEQQLLTALFGASPEEGAVRELAKNDAALGTAVNAVSSAASTQLSTIGYRGSPSALGLMFPAIAFVLVFAGFGVLALGIFGGTIPVLGFLGIALSFVAVFATALMLRGKPPLTPAGQEKSDYLRGMKMYLELAEKERFRMLQSPDGAERVDIGNTKDVIKLYEKLLPFAVIWGVEDQWMKELEIRVQQSGESPEWFASTRGFSSVALNSSLRGITTTATYTAPPPSWSSGSGPTSWSGGSGSGRSSFGSRSGGSRGGSRAGRGGRGGGGGGR